MRVYDFRCGWLRDCLMEHQFYFSKAALSIEFYTSNDTLPTSSLKWKSHTLFFRSRRTKSVCMVGATRPFFCPCGHDSKIATTSSALSLFLVAQYSNNGSGSALREISAGCRSHGAVCRSLVPCANSFR